MIAIPSSEFFTDWITLIPSFWFFFKRCSNFLKQNFGFCKICLQDWLICAQNFQIFNIQIPKNFFSKMLLKAWISDEFLKKKKFRTDQFHKNLQSVGKIAKNVDFSLGNHATIHVIHTIYCTIFYIIMSLRFWQKKKLEKQVLHFLWDRIFFWYLIPTPHYVLHILSGNFSDIYWVYTNVCDRRDRPANSYFKEKSTNI